MKKLLLYISISLFLPLCVTANDCKHIMDDYQMGKIIESMNNQKEEVFSGKASKDKKDAYVNGEIIENAGVANFIYIAKKINIDKSVFNDLISISSYAKQSDIYFACKALNYRVDDEKWDGNRHLAVWV